MKYTLVNQDDTAKMLEYANKERRLTVRQWINRNMEAIQYLLYECHCSYRELHRIITDKLGHQVGNYENFRKKLVVCLEEYRAKPHSYSVPRKPVPFEPMQENTAQSVLVESSVVQSMSSTPEKPVVHEHNVAVGDVTEKERELSEKRNIPINDRYFEVRLILTRSGITWHQAYAEGISEDEWDTCWPWETPMMWKTRRHPPVVNNDWKLHEEFLKEGTKYLDENYVEHFAVGDGVYLVLHVLH